MARPQSRYVCQSCGDDFPRWEGQCRACGSWNTLVETVVRDARRARSTPSPAGAPVTANPLGTVAEAILGRIPIGIAEVDRVLGGGLVPGSLVLLGGEPGIGKSTLLLQAAAGLTRNHDKDPTAQVLYATGEESAAQVRLRADRLGLLEGPSATAIHVAAENDVGRIAELARRLRPAAIVIDSIQTITSDDLDGPAGSVGQVRESALRIMELAKGEGIAVILVGHVTKDGSLAGPKTLEHLVDAVLALEGDAHGSLRLLRATKNRFGSTEEVGVFEMGELGLSEVADPSRAFLADHEGPAPGSVVAATLEGSRPLLVEVQSLVAPSGYGTPMRKAIGVDPNRLSLLVAVLGRRAGIALGTQDVYVNLAGGLAVDDPGIDLPLALAIASSARDRPIPSRTVAIGEIGLLGELRPVAGLERRLREAARLGFTRAIVPSRSRGGTPPVLPELDVIAVATVADAVREGLHDAAGGATRVAASVD
ncbi:MAG: DNA repair protein RadA [Chloroflexota bacterium]